MALNGSGTESDPYQITSVSELETFLGFTGDYGELTQDIDCTGYNWTVPESDGITLDGNGYTVSNLNITKTADSENAHLISTTGATPVIQNITFDNFDFEAQGQYAYGSFITNSTVSVNNLTLTNSDLTLTNSNAYDVSAVCGTGTGSYSDITLDNVFIQNSGGDIAGVVEGDLNTDNLSNITIKNSEFDAAGNAGGLYLGYLGGGANNIIVKDTVVVADGQYGAGAVGQYTTDLSEFKIVNVDISTSNSSQELGLLFGRTTGSDTSNTVEHGYISKSSVTGASNNAVFSSETNSATYNEIYIEGTTGDWSLSDDIFGDGGGSYSAIYYDSETTDISNTSATSLTTSEMKGSSAETNMTGFDFTTTWVALDGEYPVLDTFYVPPFDADILLNSPEDGVNFVSDEQFAFDFQVTNNESSVQGNVDLTVDNPDGSTSNPLSQTLAAGSSNTYNSTYSSTALGTGTWTVSVDGTERVPVSKSRGFKIFDESELSFDVDATDLSKVFFDIEIVGTAQVSYTVFKNGTEQYSSDLSPGDHGVKTRSVDVSGETGATTVAVRVETSESSTGSGIELFNLTTDQVI